MHRRVRDFPNQSEGVLSYQVRGVWGLNPDSGLSWWFMAIQSYSLSFFGCLEMSCHCYASVLLGIQRFVLDFGCLLAQYTLRDCRKVGSV